VAQEFQVILASQATQESLVTAVQEFRVTRVILVSLGTQASQATAVRVSLGTQVFLVIRVLLVSRVIPAFLVTQEFLEHLVTQVLVFRDIAVQEFRVILELLEDQDREFLAIRVFRVTVVFLVIQELLVVQVTLAIAAQEFRATLEFQDIQVLVTTENKRHMLFL
jgi:hypothetical protein